MKKSFSKSWISSKQKRKQRKYRANAPLHIRKNFVSANLSKPLREKYKKRSMPVRKGDSVVVMRGSFKGKSGKVERVDLKKGKVYISEISYLKKDGSKVHPPIDPSNLQITNLTLDDDRRFGKKSAKTNKTSKESSKAESKEKEKQKESNEKQPKDKEVKTDKKTTKDNQKKSQTAKKSKTASSSKSELKSEIKSKEDSNLKSQKSRAGKEKNQNASD